jgi:hypothetical protein
MRGDFLILDNVRGTFAEVRGRIVGGVVDDAVDAVDGWLVGGWLTSTPLRLALLGGPSNTVGDLTLRVFGLPRLFVVALVLVLVEVADGDIGDCKSPWGSQVGWG